MTILGDCGWKTVDAIDFRNAHLFEEAPGVRRHGFQIATLGFRIKRVEGQRGLAGPGHTGENDQRITRYLHIDVLEVVLPCPLYRNKPGELSVRTIVWSAPEQRLIFSDQLVETFGEQT